MTGFWSTSANAVQAVAWLIPCCTEHNGDRGTDTGSVPPTDFWATSAQTMPVLALALVVEGRVIVRGWIPGRDRAWKSLQGFLWAFSLLTYAFAEPVCFRALAGEEVWSGWSALIQQSIQVGSAALIIAPAIELFVRSNARAFVRLSRGNLHSGLLLLVQRWRYAPRLRRISKKQKKAQTRVAGQLARIDTLEAWANSVEDEAERESRLAEIVQFRAEVLETRRGIEETQGEIDALTAMMAADRAAAQARRKELLDQHEEELERWNSKVAKPAPSDDDTDSTPAPSP
jgi:hypothetical protein